MKQDETAETYSKFLELINTFQKQYETWIIPQKGYNSFDQVAKKQVLFVFYLFFTFAYYWNVLKGLS